MSDLDFGSHRLHAKRLRGRAEECRVLAEIVGDETAQASYILLASAYETLATHEEVMRTPTRIEDVLGAPSCFGERG